MKPILIGVTVAVLLAVGVRAYDGFFNPLAVGSIFSAPTTASLTCYPIDSGYHLAAANATRADILATFVKTEAGKDVSVCFLRPASMGTEWERIPTAPIPEDSPTPQPCPGFPNPPYPGMECQRDGGWRFPL